VCVRTDVNIMNAEVGIAVFSHGGEVHSGRPALPERVVQIPPFRGHTGLPIRGDFHFQGTLLTIACGPNDANGILRFPNGLPTGPEHFVPGSPKSRLSFSLPRAQENFHIALGVPAERGLLSESPQRSLGVVP